MKNLKGKMSGFIAVKEDITEKKNYEQELRRLGSFPEDNPNVVVEMDLESGVTYMNPTCQKRFPEIKEKYRNHPLFKKIPALIPLFLKGEIEKIEDEISVDDKIFERIIKFVPHGKIIRVYAVDITHHKEVEKELLRATQKAEEANRLKSEFLTNMSHEIRTPMNVIMGFTDILLMDESNPERKEHLEVIQRAGENLLNLINKILDFSKIEAGVFDVANEVFSLHQALENIRDIFQDKSKKAGVTFRMEIPDSLPTGVRGDEHRLNQMLLNLVGNAFKFTEQGSVSLKCSYENGTAAIMVTDTGIGIPKDKLDSIFSPFMQVDASTTRIYGGTGLGLSITKRLAELMGGTISVKSKEGAGSSFTLTLPLPEASGVQFDTSSPRPEKTVSEGTTIVEKWFATGRDIFNTTEYTRICISNLPDKISRLKDAVFDQNREDIHFIVHDLKGSTGNLGMNEIFEIASEINDLVIKEPLDMPRIRPLSHRIEEIVSSIPASYFTFKTPDFRQSHENETDFKILVAEDNDLNQRLMVNLIERVNLGTDLASNGKEALEMLGRTKYDLLFLDMQMPVMDGMETISKIRTDENLRDLHVIALTGHTMKGAADRYIKAGCNDYLAKPIDRHKFFDRINTLVAKKLKQEMGKKISAKGKGHESADHMNGGFQLTAGQVERIEAVVSGLKTNMRIFKPDEVKILADSLSKFSNETGIPHIREQLYSAVKSFDDQVLMPVISRLEALIHEQTESGSKKQDTDS